MPKPKKKSKQKSAKAKKPKKFVAKQQKPNRLQEKLKPASGGSKAATVIELLESSGGASIAELAAKTGWQPHTCRAKISVLGKSMKIVKSKNTDGELVYRKLGGAQPATAKR